MKNHPGSRLHWNSLTLALHCRLSSPVYRTPVYEKLSDLRSPTSRIEETKAEDRGARPWVSEFRSSRRLSRSPGLSPARISAQVSRNPGCSSRSSPYRRAEPQGGGCVFLRPIRELEPRLLLRIGSNINQWKLQTSRDCPASFY